MTIALADKRSRELRARARSRLAAAAAAPEDDAPLFIDHGSGAMVQDADGNQFIDYLCAWGAAIAGHAHPDVVAAICEQAVLGAAFGAPALGEVVLAEEICRRIAPVQMLRFVPSLGAAGATALEIAIATTGRRRLLTFAGADRGAFGGRPMAAVAGEVVTVPWNDGAAVVAACAEHDFAAIVAEPYMTSIGLMPPVEGFLELLRNQADENGALLIFDAAATAPRVAAGGAQERSGVFADLTLLGPLIGGGLPLAAVGGRADLVAAGASGPHSAREPGANPVAVAAGTATLGLLDEAAYAQLETTTCRLADGLEAAARMAAVPLVVHRVCGLLSIFFTADAPRDHAGAAASDDAAFAAFRRGMLARGIHLPPSPRTPWFPSLAHSTDHVQQTIEAAGATLQEVSQR